MRSTNTVAMNISDVADLGALETLGKACATCWEILQDETVHSALDGAEHLLRQLTAILAAGSASQEISPADVLLSSVLDEGRAILARLSQGNETPGRFEWVDGPLTRYAPSCEIQRGGILPLALLRPRLLFPCAELLRMGTGSSWTMPTCAIRRF